MQQILKAAMVLLMLLILTGCDIEANTTNATESAAVETRDPNASEDTTARLMKPVMTGEQVPGVTLHLWRKPYDNDSGSNSAWNAPSGSRVEVYEDFILVTTDDGVARICYAGYYTGLAIKRD